MNGRPWSNAQPHGQHGKLLSCSDTQILSYLAGKPLHVPRSPCRRILKPGDRPASECARRVLANRFCVTNQVNQLGRMATSAVGYLSGWLAGSGPPLPPAKCLWEYFMVRGMTQCKAVVVSFEVNPTVQQLQQHPRLRSRPETVSITSVAHVHAHVTSTYHTHPTKSRSQEIPKCGWAEILAWISWLQEITDLCSAQSQSLPNPNLTPKSKKSYGYIC